MTARTPSQMGRYKRNKGANAELALVRYLRAWWPLAERAVRTGYRTKVRTSADPGDLTNTPGVVWSCKNTPKDTHCQWLDELDRMHAQPGDLKLLVHKRAGHASPEFWWCWMRLGTLQQLLSSITALGDPNAPVRMELGHVMPLLNVRSEEAAWPSPAP